MEIETRLANMAAGVPASRRVPAELELRIAPAVVQVPDLELALAAALELRVGLAVVQVPDLAVARAASLARELSVTEWLQRELARATAALELRVGLAVVQV